MTYEKDKHPILRYIVNWGFPSILVFTATLFVLYIIAQTNIDRQRYKYKREHTQYTVTAYSGGRQIGRWIVNDYDLVGWGSYLRLNNGILVNADIIVEEISK